MNQQLPTSPPSGNVEMLGSPFLCHWLLFEQISLGFTTYQTNRLFLIGGKPDGRLAASERVFDKPMGLFAADNCLYMSTRYQIWRLDNVLAEGENYNTYDKLYVPRVGYTTGDLNVHDIVVDESEKIIFINTSYSCLATLSARHSFTAIWKPPFISKLRPEDRCHLNGLAMVDGKPAYVTAVSRSDVVQGWRDRRVDGGVVIDVRSNEIIAAGLSMPHSPRVYQGKLWVLNAGTGELGYIDSEKFVPIAFCPGFLRGLAFWGNYALVGMSKPRHEYFQGLALDKMLAAKDTVPRCGLMVVDLKTGNIAHWLDFPGAIKELFDVVVLPGVLKPSALGFKSDEIQHFITFEEKDLNPQPLIRKGERSDQALANSAKDYLNQGIQFKQQNALEKAADCFRQALHLKPDYVAAHNNLGNILQALGESEKALLCYQKAVELAPNSATAHSNLGSALLMQGKLNRAEASLRRTLELKPDYAIAHYNLAMVLDYQGRVEAALESYQQAQALAPQVEEIFYRLNYLRLQLCDWDNYDVRIQEFINRLSTYLKTNPGIPLAPFILSAFPVPCAMHTDVAQRMAQIISQSIAQIKASCNFTHDHNLIPQPQYLLGQGESDSLTRIKQKLNHQKLRIGYVSSDLREHPVGMLMQQMFQYHSRDSFEIYAYSIVNVDDEIQRSIKSQCDVFVNISEMGTVAAANRIYADGIHILIDLAGYTNQSRPEIFALQPAPIQAQYLSYSDTMGANFIPYLLADSVAIPEELAHYYTEQIVYLTHAFVASPMEISDKQMTRREFGLPEDGVVFCCFNAHYKIDPVVFDIWMRILQRVPHSVLWLSEGISTTMNNLRQEARKRGIVAERLIFASRLPLSEYLGRYRLADLFLDTFTYNAGSTAICALWGGVPVLTRPGLTYAQRMGASLCNAIGLEEMICHSHQAYEERAVYLATQKEKLTAIRDQLAANRYTAPLFDTPKFVQELESAFGYLWTDYLERTQKRMDC
ncbi:TIGR03032 family protein [Nostoc sp. UHCC 0702]|nr:TIGR03032 family protein [Nostoc sp. UHCC 0702]